MVKNSLWNKDRLHKIDNLKEYMEEVWRIKDSVFEFRDIMLKKRKIYEKAKAKYDLQNDKLQRAYKESERFRQKL